MKRICPFIFWTIPSASNFIVLGLFSMVHFHLFIFHSHNKLLDTNIVIELAMWKINVLIFTVVGPCEHCGKHTHHSDKCFKNKTPARMKIHLGWITSWLWSSRAKTIYRSYHRICSRVLTSLIVNISSSSHLVSQGGVDGQLLALKVYQESLNKS